MTESLPDYYPTVADVVTAFCADQGERISVDLGPGIVGLGLALLNKISDGALVRLLEDRGVKPSRASTLQTPSAS